MTTTIESVVLYGYGVMGRGIGNTFAAAGLDVTVRTSRAAALGGSHPRIRFVAELPAAPPDLVLELVPEDLETKRAVFREIEARYGDADFLLATGTSGLDLNVLAEGLKRPERLIALHYYMPAEAVPIVEVAAGPAAPREAVDRAAALLASAQDIDLAATRMLGPRMCVSGLVLQKDISGLKVNRDAQRAIVPHLYHNNRPNPLPGELFAGGETGLAAGKGFYDWAGRDAAEVRKTHARELQKLIDFLDEETFECTGRVEPQPRSHSRKAVNRGG